MAQWKMRTEDPKVNAITEDLKRTQSKTTMQAIVQAIGKYR